MTTRGRQLLFLAGAAGVGSLLVAALLRLTAVDEFADFISTYYLSVGVVSRNSYNVVSSVVFDYRGFDTMVEQLILFAAVVGVALLLRVQTEEVERRPEDSLAERAVPPTSGAVKLLGIALAGFTFLVAVYIILHVHVTPGGGFQSGVLLAGGLLAIYIADEFDVYDRLTREWLVERAEAVAAGAFVAVGFAGIAVGGAFLENVFPLGELGDLYAAGTIWVLNLIVTVEVTAGFVLVFTEFLGQVVVIRGRGGG